MVSRIDMMHERKWWLLKNGRIMYFSGYLLLFASPVWGLFFMFSYPFFLLGFLFIPANLFAALLVVNLSRGYSNIYNVLRELSLHLVVEDFYPVTIRVVIEDMNNVYTISYHVIQIIAPDHYKIWTPLKELEGYYFRSIYSFNKYVYLSLSSYFTPILFFPSRSCSKQRKTIFDDNLMKICSHLHDWAKAISSLRFVGLARHQGEAGLLAMLTQYATSAQVDRTIELLGILVDEIGLYQPEILYKGSEL